MAFYIIEKSDQLQNLEFLDKSECFINVITWNDFYHPKLTLPSLIYYKNITTNKGFILCLNHSESFGLNKDNIMEFLMKHKNIYVLDHKFHLYFIPDRQYIDVNFNRLYHNKPIINDMEYNTTSHNIMYGKHESLENIDKIIPISKHYEKWEKIYDEIREDIYMPPIQTIVDNTNIVNAFFSIEFNGITVDSKQLDKYYEPHIKNLSIVNNKIFTYYNVYNNTTRPSNSFNGINFSALPKNSRSTFIADNDYLVEFDYNEYHPRLIADLIGYKMNNTSIYEELSILFNCSIEETKKLTFKQFYGGIESKYLEIEYFNKINSFVEDKWVEFTKLGYVELFGNRRGYVEEPTKSKILSYIIQSLETYKNTRIINLISPILKNKKSKLVHYTYDSFLFDVDMSEKTELNLIKDIITKHFPVKISYGDNYKDMHRWENI